MKKSLQVCLLLLIAVSFQHCTPSSQTKKPIGTASKIRPIKNTYSLTTENGIVLSVDIEYSLSEQGYMNNGCRAQYIVTNIGKTAFYYQEQKKHRIVFEFLTSDGKVIEQSQLFPINIQPKNSSPAQTITTNVGVNRFCMGVKAVRFEE
ncbi:hypothetical protein [Pinibacter aurantiacus]|uniref:DUF1425 domain-containing protein n=1 Tax=Pinibacter aurantiacus TaxID=2851599 RepID=A0A9E2SC78_9BACT|nr:hypothetical protein [Pinibacter aurantiacus]MBV4357710.1 hypothetical protein [Pinibacter aurantiacus]